MKKRILVIGCLIGMGGFVMAQTDYFKGININGNDGFYFFEKSIDGGIIACGVSNGNDLFLIKLDSIFNVEWFNPYKDTTNSIFKITPNSILPTPDSGFFLCGSFSQPVVHGALIKFNKTGNIQWYKRYVMPNSNFGLTSMISINDSEYVLSGVAGATCITTNKSHVVICKIDSSGDLIWNKYYRATAVFCDAEVPYDIIKTNDSGFLITGTNRNYGFDSFVMKIDSIGNLQWNKIHQGRLFIILW